MEPDAPANLTLEEHQQLGRELRATKAQLRELSRLVLSLYGPENQAAVSFVRAADAVERLCDHMQQQAAHDLPGVHLDGLYR